MEWKGYAELVGIAAIVASLVFVGLQMQQTEDIARYERYSDAMDPVAIATMLSENRDVWLRGCAGEELSEQEWLTFVQLVDVINIRRNARWEINRLIDAESQSAPQVATFRHALDLYSNPGMLKAWQARVAVREQTGYYMDDVQLDSQNFTREVQKALERVKRDPPDTLSDGSLCGVR
jgi:hypothetical protein